MHHKYRFLNLFSFISLFYLTSAALAIEDGFLLGFDDVPLLDGYKELNPKNRVIFDTPSGTIAETTVLVPVSEKSPIPAYNAALAGLGWSCNVNKMKLSCRRDSVSLEIEKHHTTKAVTTLIVKMSPSARL